MKTSSFHFYIDNEDKLLALESKLYPDLMLSRSDLFLLLLLESTHISRQQIVKLGFATDNTIHQFVTALERKKFIRSHTYRHGSNKKVYTLTGKGYTYLSSRVSSSHLEKMNFVEVRKVQGNMEHKLRLYDFYYALLTSPFVNDVNFVVELEIGNLDLPGSRKVTLRVDGQLEVDGNQLWLEQDMGTESITQLRKKAKRLRKAGITNDLIFTISQDHTYTTLEKNRLYSSIPEVRYLKSLRTIMEEMEVRGDESINQYINFVREYSLRVENPRKRVKFTQRYNLATSLRDTYGIENYVALLSEVKLLEEKCREMKRERFTQVTRKTFMNRREILYRAIGEGEDESNLTDLMLNGLDIYVLDNKDIDGYVNMDYFSDSTIIQKVKETYSKMVESITRELQKQFVKFPQQTIVLSNCFLTDTETIMSIEDIGYNLTSRKRLEVISKNLHLTTKLSTVIIVDTEEEIRSIYKRYFTEPYVNGLYFAIRKMMYLPSERRVLLTMDHDQVKPVK